MGKHRWNGISRMTNSYSLRHSPSMGWVRVYYFGSSLPSKVVPLCLD